MPSSELLLKTAAMAASGGGLLFTLLLAKYQAPASYSLFITTFAVASYISFPFLYGFLPEALRRHSAASEEPLRLVASRTDGVIFYGYAALALIAAGFVAPDSFTGFIQVCALLSILLTAGGEAHLRAAGNGQGVFLLRAGAALVSIFTILVAIGVNSQLDLPELHAARFAPALMLITLAVLLRRPRAAHRFPQRTVQPLSASGIASATSVSLCAGVFQYAFVAASRVDMAPSVFVTFSIFLIASTTSTLKLVEPLIFAAYAAGPATARFPKRAWILAAELCTVAFFAQILIAQVLEHAIDWRMIISFSIAAPLIGLGHYTHTILFIRHTALKTSAALLASLLAICFIQSIGLIPVTAYILYVVSATMYAAATACAYRLHLNRAHDPS